MLDCFAIFTKAGLLNFLYSPFLDQSQSLLLLNKFIENELVDKTTSPVNNSLYEYRSMKNAIIVALYPKELFDVAYIPLLLDNLQIYLKEKAVFGRRNIEGFDEKVFQEFLELAEFEASRTAYPQSRKQKKEDEKKKSSKGDGGRKWGLGKEEIKALDYSKKSSTPTSSASSTAEIISLKAELEDLQMSASLKQQQQNQKSLFWNAFQSVAGGKVLESNELTAPLRQLSDHLVSKNVAPAVASLICTNVEENLVGKKTSAFQSLKSMVMEDAESVIKSLIASESASQLLGEIKRHCANSEIYSLAFVGVNGVGKSTSLAKVASWLLNNGLKVLIVAGDTFRAGAVEQLKKHVLNLKGAHGDKVDLFEKGYGKDAAVITPAAQAFAKTSGFNVVLIDTAGRMPTNPQLMQALSDLVEKSSPNRIIFVGEALAGNEAITQITNFNSSISPAKIDCLLVSKFDTVDDKVGAVLNMCHTARAPVLFVGAGQTYDDLKTLSPSLVMQYLLQ
jgi:signal recognition particle receptor subunit alpha